MRLVFDNIRWSSEGQLRLQSASVVVVGAGGLGCPALQYLGAAGVGKGKHPMRWRLTHPITR